MAQRGPSKKSSARKPPQEPLQETMVTWNCQATIKARSLDEFEEKREIITSTLGRLGIFAAINVQSEDEDDDERDTQDEDDEDDDSDEPPEGELDFDT